MKKNLIPVIDLFAGPGGLGEGFSSFLYEQQPVFNIQLSIEKDPNAHRTLRLRSFFRKVPADQVKEIYFEFMKSERTEHDESKLYSYFPDINKEINSEVLCKELGSENFPQDRVQSIINERLTDKKRWVLIGGPPCQAYSIAGRSRMSRIRKEDLTKFEEDKRHYLYQQYLKIIAEHKPPVFVMENVKGMLSSTIKGDLIIDQIINDLKNPVGSGDLRYNLYSFTRKPRDMSIFSGPEFKTHDFVIRAEDYGIPQSRHRVIILGVRSDINVEPETLDKKDQIHLRDVISDLPPIRSGISLTKEWNKTWSESIWEIKDLFVDDNSSLTLNRYMKKTLRYLGEELPTGGTFMTYLPGRPNKFVSECYRKNDFKGVCNHESRTHMPSDLQRYFFASCFTSLNSNMGNEKSPTLSDFPQALLPNHKNIDITKLKETVFADRFRVQLWNSPATTITSHIAKDGHYFIHPDPSQCRSLTVREAARIQTFPDDYIFLGSRGAQYKQVGNAVPPLLASQLAGIVFNLLKYVK
jgi:DNA (cytosine-5)-methyltransferase 1